MELFAAISEALVKAPILSSTIFTIIAMVAAFFCYFYEPYWSVRKVPGPPPFPILGHIPLLAKHGPDVFTVLAKRYGPVFRYCSILLFIACGLYSVDLLMLCRV